MNDSQAFWDRKYSYAGILAFVGLCAVLSGEPEGVWLIAAGAIVVILVRRIQRTIRGQ